MKVLFISNMAAPYQIKFCNELNKYFEIEFWFYKYIEKTRPDWWKIPLGEKCKIIENSFYIPIFNYNSFGLVKKIANYRPDVIILGGFFFPSHYNVKKWAKKNNKLIIISNEKIEYDSLNLVSKIIKKIYYTLLFTFFKDIDYFLALGSEVADQHATKFNFKKLKEITKNVRYAQDIDVNIKRHKTLHASKIRLIFPNRLINKYNPIFIIEVFNCLCKKHDNLLLNLNAFGDLRDECEKKIIEYEIRDKVKFLDDINNWNDLPDVYIDSDIALFACTDSNGPNSLIESMAAGLGVVMCDTISNTDEYAIDNINCFKVELDLNSFITAIERYITNPALVLGHGTQSKKLVFNRSIEGTALLYKEILENLYNEYSY